MTRVARQGRRVRQRRRENTLESCAYRVRPLGAFLPLVSIQTLWLFF